MSKYLSRWSGPVRLEMHRGRIEERTFEIIEDISYKTDVAGGHIISIPAGYRTDFLSIPRFFSRMFQRVGKGAFAALPHDVLCEENLRPEWCVDHFLAADVFNEALKDEGVNSFKRRLMVWAVKNYGPKWYLGEYDA